MKPKTIFVAREKSNGLIIGPAFTSRKAFVKWCDTKTILNPNGLNPFDYVLAQMPLYEDPPEDKEEAPLV